VKVRISPFAEAEVDEIHAWYDSHQVGLGETFRAELDRMMGQIGDHPEMFQVVFDDVRRAIMKRFPYFLLYEVFPTVVIVFNVVHGARDPRLWTTRGDA
jgi:plasmid stabilization system protein ParE